jgi:hypothetical protein
MSGPAEDPCKRYYEGDRRGVRLITSRGDKGRLFESRTAHPEFGSTGAHLLCSEIVRPEFTARLLSLRLGIAVSPALLEHLFELLLLGIVEQSLDPGFAVLHDALRFGMAILGGE